MTEIRDGARTQMEAEFAIGAILGVPLSSIEPVDRGALIDPATCRRACRYGRDSTHCALSRLGSGRWGASSMSPTYQRANRLMMTERFASGSARLAASSSRCHRSSSMRMRRNGVPSGAMLSVLLSGTVSVTGNPLIFGRGLHCSYSMPYTVAMSKTLETPAAEPVACTRCGRELKSASSRLAKIGPRCAAIKAATEGLSAKQVDKMQQLILDNAIVATSRKGVYKVINEAGEVIHTCHVNGNCDCDWGRKRDSAEIKTCYHAAGAKLLARPVIRHTAPVTAPVALPSSTDMWAELDRWNDALMAMAG